MNYTITETMGCYGHCGKTITTINGEPTPDSPDIKTWTEVIKKIRGDMTPVYYCQECFNKLTK